MEKVAAEKRKEARLPLHRPLKVVNATDGRAFGVAKDISRSGLQISTSYQINILHTHHLNLLFPNDYVSLEGGIIASAQVCWMHPTEKRNSVLIGFQFEHLTENNFNLIEEFIQRN